MTPTVFVTARITGPPGPEFIETISSVNRDAEIVLYVFGDRSKGGDATGPVPSDAADEVFYDHDLEGNLPESPDTEYLSAFERSLEGENLWRAIVADRRLSKDGVAELYHRDTSDYDYDELLKHLEVRSRFLDSLFEERSFDMVYDQHIMYLGGALTALVAEREQVPSYRVATTRVSDRYTVQLGLDEWNPMIAAAFDDVDGTNELPLGEAREYLRVVRGGQPLYTIPETDRLGGIELSLESITKFMRNPTKYISSDYYYDVPGVQIFRAKVEKKLRRRWLSIRRDFDSFDPGRRFAYFPLQLQPELALMIRSRFHTDFHSVIRNVVRSLPVGMELYVNEHPEMYGVRGRDYYRSLQDIPGVRVLDRAVDTRDVIDNADLTVCISSSAGLLSLIQETPVVTLSSPTYSILECVECPQSWEDVFSAIQRALTNGVDEPELVRFIAANLEAGISHKKPRREYFRALAEQMRPATVQSEK